jgi:hypothetical protein
MHIATDTIASPNPREPLIINTFRGVRRAVLGSLTATQQFERLCGTLLKKEVVGAASAQTGRTVSSRTFLVLISEILEFFSSNPTPK